MTAADAPLPAWSLHAGADNAIAVDLPWAGEVTREWAFGGATGAGIRVCLLDSGVESTHPRVGAVDGTYAVAADADGEPRVVPDDSGDVCGHGTACASIIRALAPECSLTSVRVLDAANRGSGRALVAALRWAVEQRHDVINLSLSTTKREIRALLHEVADGAYFRRTAIVASAHNMPVESYPWRFSSVISVGSHEERDPLAWYYNPDPPVEFFARGIDVDVAWLGGTTLRTSGNSFATPHVTGLCALVLSKHRRLAPFQLKSVLALTANNAGAAS